LAAVERGPGLAVICLPQTDLSGVVGEAAAAGCRAALLIGGGGELASDPAAAAVARAQDIRLVGPDRVGIIVPGIGLTAGCVAEIPPAGDLAFVTQSDSLATTLLAWAGERRIGFSRIVSLGDSAAIELGDILDYLALDAATRAVLLHVQGIADARRFMSAARASSR
jgi:acetyltransferase